MAEKEYTPPEGVPNIGTPERDAYKNQLLSDFNKSLGINQEPSVDIKNPIEYNPKPVASDVLKQVTGNPFTGPDPGIRQGTDTHFANLLGNIVDTTSATHSDPYSRMKPFTYNGDFDGANFERYYGTNQFKKLGFNPYRDNEALYNQHMTFGEEFARSASQWPSLVATGFMSGIKSWGTMFSDPLSPDLASARKMQRAMVIGSSTKKGVGSFFINTALNSGYTVGIGADLLLEELGLAGITALTGGTSAEGTIPAMLARLTKAGKNVGEGIEAAHKVEELLQANRQLNTMSGLRTFFESNKVGQGLAKAGAVMNPFEHSWEVAKQLARGTNNINNIGEFARWSGNFAEFSKDMIMIKSAVSEASLEGGMAQIDITKNLIDKYREAHEGLDPSGEEMVKIENLAKDEAHRVGLWNLPAIMWSNKFMYEAVFKPFEKGGKKLIDDIAFNKKTGFEVVGEGIGDRAKALGKALLDPKSYGKFGKNYLEANFAEGIQENLQDAISQGAAAHAVALYTDPKRGSYEGYMGHFMTHLGKQFSAQGAETFAGGFLMGSLAQPVMGAPMWAGQKLWNNTINRGKYQEYKAERTKQLQQTADQLNEMYKNPHTYFAPDLSNAIAQGRIADNLYDATISGDKEGFITSQDNAKFNHIMTALETGHYDTFIHRLKEFKNYTPEESAAAFGVSDGTKAQSLLDNIINRAKDIKKNYDEVSSNYPNPYDPKLFREGDPKKEGVENSYKAWELAKRNLVLGKSTFERHSKRIEEIATAFSGKSKALANASAQDLHMILDPVQLNQYTKSLSKEISSIPDGIGLNRDKTQKQKKLDLLEDIMHNFHSEEGIDQYYKEIIKEQPSFKQTYWVSDPEHPGMYPNGTYVTMEGVPGVHKVVGKPQMGTYTLEYNNQKGTEFNAHMTSVIAHGPHQAREIARQMNDRSSRKAFKNYIDFLAKDTGDFVFDENIEKSYQLIKDHINLKQKMYGIVRDINVLNNPKGFLRVQTEIAKALSKIRQDQSKIIADTLEDFKKKITTNTIINELAKDPGVLLTPEFTDELASSLLFNRELPDPTSFTDLDSKEVITSGEKFDKGLEKWKAQKGLIKDELEGVEAKKEKTKEEPIGRTKDTTVKVITDETSYEDYPQDVKLKLADAFFDYLKSEGEDVENMSDEEMDEKRDLWIQGSSEAEFIIDQHNKQSSVVTTPLVNIPGLKTVKLPQGKTLDTLNLTELDKLFQNTKTEALDPRNKEAAEDTIALRDYILRRKITEAGNPAQKKALEKVKDLTQNEEGAKTINISDDKAFYIIDGEPYRRVTDVAKEITGKTFTPLSEQDNGEIILNKFDELFAQEGMSPAKLIDGIKADPTVERFFNDRKLKEIQLGLEQVFNKENFKLLLDKYAFDHTTIRGNSVDELVRKYFNQERLEKPKGMAKEAYDNLITSLENIASLLVERGEIIVANNLVVHGKGPVNVAGSMDLLVITKDGEFRIYDIKTASKKKWKEFSTDPESSKEQYTVQLSLYKNLLENQTGIKVKNLALIPIVTAEDLDGNVLSAEAITKEDNKLSIPITYDPRVEALVPKLQSPVTEPIIGEVTKPIKTKGVISFEQAYLNLDTAEDMGKFDTLEQDLLNSIDASLSTDQMKDAMDLISRKKEELKKVISIQNLKWAQKNNMRVTYDNIPGFTVKVGRKNITLAKPSAKYKLPIDQMDKITAITDPTSLTADVDISQEGKEQSRENIKTEKDVLNKAADIAKEKQRQDKLNLNQSNNDLLNNIC